MRRHKRICFSCTDLGASLDENQKLKIFGGQLAEGESALWRLTGAAWRDRMDQERAAVQHCRAVSDCPRVGQKTLEEAVLGTGRGSRAD